MSDEIRELQLRVANLEAGLAIAKSELARRRQRVQRLRGIVPIALVVAATTLLIAAAPLQSPVTAPFQVVDSTGKKIFEVHDGDFRGFALYDAAQLEVLTGVANEGHSYLSAASASGSVRVRMGVTGEGHEPAFDMRDGGDRLSMAVTDGEPMLNMANESNVVIVEAGQGEHSGGLLLLTDFMGIPRVKFSTSSNGAGTVVTYPNEGVGGSIVGLKGTMLCGLKGCGQ
jgi:hypothetical protein